MFTGIIEEAGVVAGVDRQRGGIHLTLNANRCSRGMAPGQSVAVNGCCLTVVRISGAGGRRRQLHFDLLGETWDRTNFRELAPGRLVNLERSLKIGGRLDGHWVTGHIDAPGIIRRVEASGADHRVEISAPPGVMRYVVTKGSVAVDGISLTVSAVRPRGFEVWIIPHTWQVTALRERRVGDAVNLEADLLAKLVEKQLQRGRGPSSRRARRAGR